jgi:hypothetical protein
VFVRQRKLGVMAVLLPVLAGSAGCFRLHMYDQPRYAPLQKSSLFADGGSSRPLVAGTVPRGYLNQDKHFYTGMEGDSVFTAVFPFAITRAVLERGQERFNIFCSPCHDRLATGRGMVVRRGYKQPESMHIDRLRQQPVGYFFDVMTNGFATMPSYAAQIPPADRWAIAAYIRALQLSQNLSAADLPADLRVEMEQSMQAPEHAPEEHH